MLVLLRDTGEKSGVVENFWFSLMDFAAGLRTTYRGVQERDQNDYAA